LSSISKGSSISTPISSMPNMMYETISVTRIDQAPKRPSSANGSVPQNSSIARRRCTT
jgi:hypothetical protein